MPIVMYGSTILRRSKPTPIADQSLFQGIVYSRRVSAQPRPHIVHIFDIDLTAAGLRPLVTPIASTAQNHKAVGLKTSDFLQTHGLQLAVNANFFSPFREVTLWNYYPRPGQPVNLSGLSISNGKVVAGANPNKIPPLPTLCFTEQTVFVDENGTCTDTTQQAVAGNLILLKNGAVTEQVQARLDQEGKKNYSFTIAALDATGTRLWLVLVDGKQPLYSEGLTLGEVTTLVQTLGADIALRLDGGGSTTAVIASSAGPKVLNAPIHAKVPGQERPVGNHLGFFANPLDP